MLPIRHKSIFKSRWMALLWAAGILWAAVDFAGGQPKHDTDGNAASNEQAADVQAAANAFDVMK